MAKVMLVEDDNNLREIYQARLQAEGYDIVTAKDGEEALVVAKAEQPDLVISDVMMPKISGFEMLDILRNTDGLKDVKIIMLTALGQSDDQQRANKLGADRYLVKSQVTLEDIVKTAHDLLGDGAAGDTPAAAPTPPPTPAPAPTQAAQDNAAASPAQTTEQEEAAVEASIENFVAGASSDAPAPAASTTTDASNDQLVAEAADSLEASTAKPQAATEPQISVVQSTATGDPEKPSTETLTQGSKKVIQPLDSEPKKDIAALAAAEEAKEEAAKPAPPPVATVATDKEGETKQPLAPDATTPDDPSSIAL